MTDRRGNRYRNGYRRKKVLRRLVLIALAAAVLYFGYRGRMSVLEDRPQYTVAGQGSGAAGGGAADVVSDAAAGINRWDGSPSVPVNGNTPQFTAEEITNEIFIRYSELDSLGRCGEASACLGPSMLPTEERGEIGSVRPSGWQTEKYSFIDNGGFLYNRCHLLAYMLTGENEEPRNLITGTRYLNTEGMLPYETEVASYIYRTGNHVMYRATPVFAGEELVARGVKIEAVSVEDHGRGLSFSVFCFNVQPGVEIDYRTGKSRMSVEQTLQGE